METKLYASQHKHSFSFRDVESGEVPSLVTYLIEKTEMVTSWSYADLVVWVYFLPNCDFDDLQTSIFESYSGREIQLDPSPPKWKMSVQYKVQSTKKSFRSIERKWMPVVSKLSEKERARISKAFGYHKIKDAGLLLLVLWSVGLMQRDEENMDQALSSVHCLPLIKMATRDYYDTSITVLELREKMLNITDSIFVLVDRTELHFALKYSTKYAVGNEVQLICPISHVSDYQAFEHSKESVHFIRSEEGLLSQLFVLLVQFVTTISFTHQSVFVLSKTSDYMVNFLKELYPHKDIRTISIEDYKKLMSLYKNY